LSSFHTNRKENTMLSNNPAEPLLPASPPRDAKAGATDVRDAILNPRSPIEVASAGSGTINDPSGTDNKPAVTADLDLDLFA
jgi:hypothetical protein